MDARTKEKYEQIRSIASRDWLKPASVSLAKLDQVKAKVYNLRVADPRQLKATSDNLAVRQIGPSAEPPSSSLVQQRHVWGSNSSIPDLLKQQNEKKKLTRPWSAQNSSMQMKVVLKKPRPHSAKDSTEKPPRPASAKKPKKTSIAIKGAHYEAAERPPGGIGACHTVSGWAAPPGGIHSEHAIEMVTQGQYTIDYKGCGSSGLVDMPPPVPPRGSPDFTHFLDKDQSSQRINSAVGELVHDLLDDTRKPTPREPIHLTLPSAQQDEEEEEEEEIYSDKEYFDDVIEDIDDWIEDRKKYNSEQLDVDKILNGFDERIEIGSISSKLLRTDIGGSAEDLCKDLESSESSSEDEFKIKEVGKKKKNVHVTFDEDKNKTRTITPREDNCATVISVQAVERNTPKHSEQTVNKRKPHHATPDLRNINGKVGSGQRPRGISRRIDRKPKDTSFSSTNTEKYLSPGRAPPSKYTAPVSTISVTYLEDEDNLNDSFTRSTKQKHKRRGEIETVISQLSDTDSEVEEQSRPESRTRTVSSNYSRTYYPNALSENKPKVLTRKTLELGDGSVIERKSIFLLDSHKQLHKSYVVPMENRPKTVPVDNRSKASAKTKPHNKPEKEDQSVTALVEPTKQLSMQDKRLENETKREDHAKPRSEMSISGSAKKVEESKPKKEVTFVENHELGDHDCRCVTPSSAAPRRAPPSTYKLPVRKQRPSSAAKKEEDERVKFPKPLSLVKQRIESDRQKRILDKTPQIITKHRDYEVEDSEGVKECRNMQDYLLDAGVPVTLETLYRALLPPTQYPVPQVSMVTNTSKPFPRHTAGLVSEPCYWLPEEHKRLQQAKKLVRQANLSLRHQELEEEREAMRAAGYITPTKKKKKRSAKKQKSIAGYLPTPKRTQSAPSGEQTQIANKRTKSAPPGGRRKKAEVKDRESTEDHISLNDLV